MRLPFLALLIYFLLRCLSISAQQNNFKMYSIEDGLPQIEVRSILEDSRGYLWVGTNSGGAARFDGIHFTLYDKKKGLCGNTIYSIFEDSKKQLWFGTDEGISIYDGFEFRKISDKDGLTSKSIYKITEDSKGNIWATTTSGVNIININAKDSIHITTLTKESGLSGNYVFDCVEDRFGRIWLATYDGGINVITISANNKISVKIIPGKILPSTNILSLGINKDGNIWAGSFNIGAFLINYSDTSNFSVSKKIDLTAGYEENRIWKIYCDEKNRVWFATDKTGVIRLNENGSFTNFSNKQGYPNNQILTLYEDSDNNFWFGTMGSGLCKYFGDYFAHYKEKEISTEKVLAIAQSKNGTYWIGTGGKGLVRLNFDKNNNPIIKIFNEKDGLFDPVVNSITIDKNGVLWVATNTSGIFSFDQHVFTNYSTYEGLIDNRVNCVFIDSKNRLWCGTMGGLSIFNGNSFFNIDDGKYELINNEVQTITEDKEGTVWIGTLGGIARFKDNQMTDFDEEEGLLDKKISCIVSDPTGNIWIGSFGVGVYLYDVKKSGTKKISLKANEDLLGTGNIFSLIFSNDSTLIIGTNIGFKMITMDRNYKFKPILTFDITNGFFGIENNYNAILKDNDNNIWFGTAKGLTRFTPSSYSSKNKAPKTHIVELFINDTLFVKKSTDSITRWSNMPTNLVLSYRQNQLNFKFEGISLKNPQRILYKYMLEGGDDNQKRWSLPNSYNEAKYSGLPPGEYVFKVKAANEYDTWNDEPETFHFIINPPFYRTWWFYTICIILIVSVIIFYIKWREAKLKHDKAILEQTVKERTAQVVKQKEILEEQKQEITDSIHYASRIQRAILPTETLINTILKDYFILYKPRDIVSGDFYWATLKDEKIFLTVADCTGHGVPGAFMSMLGVSFLNEIVNEKGIVSPDVILNMLRGNIVNALQQKETMGGSKDGMDIALVCIDEKRKIIQYAGANNSLYVFRENQLREIKADKMPIAIYLKMESFLNHEIPYQKGDAIYLFSDGYTDQFGGPKGKKFMSKHFKEFLLSINELPMITQQFKLNQRIEEWQLESNQSQNDDICVIGLRL